MNKVRLVIVLVAAFIFGCCIDVNAAGASLSVSSGSVYVGDSFTVSVNINQEAAWNVHVSSSGPVTGCSISQADSTANALNTSKRFSAKCTATGVGRISINLSGDVTSAPSGNYSNVSGSSAVYVTTRPKPSNNSNSGNKNNNTNTSKKSESDKKDEDKSDNCNLKSISVEGYKAQKKDANNYTLTVPNNISTINVKAVAEDNKANVKGTGKHNLKVGTNNIEIVIVAESGKEKKINLKVTRKKEMGLSELDELLKSSKQIIEINNDSNSNLSSQQLSKIKSSGKTIILNHKEKGIIKYSWIIDGKKIKDFDQLLTLVNFNSKNKKKISKLSNYAEGIYLSFEHTSDFPDGVKLKVYVKDKYSDGDKVNIYYYDNKKMVLQKKSLRVKDGYVEFDIDKGYDHFITMSSLQLSDKKVKKESESLAVPMIILFTGLLFLGIVLIIIRKKKPSSEEIL